MTRDELWDALDRGADGVDDVDFAAAAWGTGRRMRRRRQVLAGSGLALGATAAAAIAFTVLGGGDLGAQDVSPASVTPTVAPAVTEAPAPTATTTTDAETSEPEEPVAAVETATTGDDGTAAPTATGVGTTGGETPTGTGTGAAAPGSTSPAASDPAPPAAEGGDPRPLTSVTVPASCGQPERVVEDYYLSHGSDEAGFTSLRSTPLDWTPAGDPGLRVMLMECAAGDGLWVQELVFYDAQAALVGNLAASDLDGAATTGWFGLEAATVDPEALVLPAGVEGGQVSFVQVGWADGPVVDNLLPVVCTGHMYAGQVQAGSAPEPVLAAAQRLLAMAQGCDRDGLVAAAEADGTVLSLGGGTAADILRVPEDASMRYWTLAATLTAGPPTVQDYGDGTTGYEWQLDPEQYAGWRVGIDATGRWIFFTAGD